MASPRLHPFWRLVLAVCVVLGITLVATSIGLGVLLALGPRIGLNQKLDLNLLASSSAVSQLTKKIVHDYGLLLTVLAYPPALFALWLFRTHADGRSWASLGFARSRAVPNFARGALTGFSTLAVLYSLMWLTGAIRFGGLSSDVQTHGWAGAVGWLSLYLLAFLCVGLMEETAFRGYGLHNLNEWLGWKWAVGIQAIGFALVHLGNAQGDHTALLAAIGALPSLALIAVFFAISYRKTGSLWFAIGFHTFWNWSLGCVFSLPVSGIGTFRLFDVQEGTLGILSGGKFGAEGSFFLLPLLLAMIYFLSLAPDHPRAVADLRGDQPQFAPVPAPLPVVMASPIEEPEEPRVNRYGARFGSGEGFDSGMLSELRTMQEERERVERERTEAEQAQQRVEDARAEELRRARIAAQAIVSVPVEAALPATEPAPAKREAPLPNEPAPVEREAPVVVVARSQETRAPVVETQEIAAPQVAVMAPPVPVPDAPVLPVETAQPNDAPAPPKKVRPRW
jgi:membrane protease YdiL (CAAX protease family)